MDTVLLGIYKDNPCNRAVADKWYKVNTEVHPELHWWKLRSPNGKLMVLSANGKTVANRETEIKRDGYEILNRHVPRGEQ